MAKRKLNYRFHNPNPVEVTADYILKVMIEANTEKVEKAIRVKMQTITEKKYNDIQKYIFCKEYDSYKENDLDKIVSEDVNGYLRKRGYVNG